MGNMATNDKPETPLHPIAISSVAELAAHQTDLDPELAAHLETLPEGFEAVRHPLVYSVPHVSIFNHLLNQQLLYKKSMIEQAANSGDWDTYICMHERPWRLWAFAQISDKLDDTTFWQLVGDIWVGCENVEQNRDDWDTIWTSNRKNRHAAMTAGETNEFNALADTLTIYQGHTTERDDGMSWTIDEKTATWFAHRFAQLERSTPAISATTIRKQHALAYFTRRNEQEVIVARDTLGPITTHPARARHQKPRRQ